MLRRATAYLAVLLAAGCTGQATPAPVAPPAPVAVAADRQALHRWSRWHGSAQTGTAQPELPQRDTCAADPGSDLWFLDYRSVVGRDDEFTCSLPAGRALLVVSVAMTGQGEELCGPDSPALPVGGDATLDGEPLVLGWAELPAPASPAAQPSCSQALWGTTKPLTAGRHTVIMKSTVDEVSTRTTAQITAR